jgi:hypothetical protein
MSGKRTLDDRRTVTLIPLNPPTLLLGVYTYNYIYLINITTGTTVITSSVVRGDRPTDVRPAYDKAPNIPAPPVPDEYADITFLNKNVND